MNPSEPAPASVPTKEDQNQHPLAQTPSQPDPPREAKFGPAVRLRSLDRGLDEELEAAMGGLSDKELYGDLSRREKKQPAAPGEAGRKKGNVLAVHGGGVLLHVP